MVVSSRDGIVFKRVFNKLKNNAGFTLHSDNSMYAPYEIGAGEVLEIWEAKSYISSTFPVADLSLERVASLVLDLQRQMATMRVVQD